jgi:isopentenyl diphosphate isomerase/L-lactate dehydrogenase-like FMN-dependent dehydrogenase
MKTSSSVKSTGSALADFMRDHKDNVFSWEII